MCAAKDWTKEERRMKKARGQGRLSAYSPWEVLIESLELVHHRKDGSYLDRTSIMSIRSFEHSSSSMIDEVKIHLRITKTSRGARTARTPRSPNGSAGAVQLLQLRLLDTVSQKFRVTNENLVRPRVPRVKCRQLAADKVVAHRIHPRFIVTHLKYVPRFLSE